MRRFEGEDFVWQCQQAVTGRHDLRLGVALADSPVGVGVIFSEEAGPVEIQIGVEELGAESIHLGCGGLGDVGIAQMLSDHHPVLGLHKGVVIA